MINEEIIRAAARLFLEGIGEDPDREGLADTPDRVARMARELFAGYEQDPGGFLETTFTSPANGIVVEKGIRFYSVCEHHLLPFFGEAAIAYIPDGKVVGLSKLARVTEACARRLQIQENLTCEIADAVYAVLQPRGVMVVTSAEHMCMSMRGVKKDSARTVSTAVRGCFEDDPALRAEAMRAMGF